MAKRKAMDVSPEQARFVTKLLKHRFPWLGTNHSMDFADQCNRLEDLHEVLKGIAAKPTVDDFVRRTAGLTKDRECATCGKDGDEPNRKCNNHEPFDMPSDDAIETLHSLINEARALRAEVK